MYILDSANLSPPLRLIADSNGINASELITNVSAIISRILSDRSHLLKNPKSIHGIGTN